MVGWERKSSGCRRLGTRRVSLIDGFVMLMLVTIVIVIMIARQVNMSTNRMPVRLDDAGRSMRGAAKEARIQSVEAPEFDLGLPGEYVDEE